MKEVLEAVLKDLSLVEDTRSLSLEDQTYMYRCVNPKFLINTSFIDNKISVELLAVKKEKTNPKRNPFLISKIKCVEGEVSQTHYKTPYIKSETPGYKEGDYFTLSQRMEDSSIREFTKFEISYPLKNTAFVLEVAHVYGGRRSISWNSELVGKNLILDSECSFSRTDKLDESASFLLCFKIAEPLPDTITMAKVTEKILDSSETEERLTNIMLDISKKLNYYSPRITFLSGKALYFSDGMRSELK